MKIFNWVHRRFTHKDGLSQSVKKADDHEDDTFGTKNGGDTQVLLDIDNVVHLADFLDGWQGSVLTIGTFGRLGSLTADDLLKQHDYDQEDALFEVDRLYDDDDEEEEEEEEEEENPLVMNRVDVVEQGPKCDPAAGAVSGRTSVMKSINEGGSSAAAVDEDGGHRHSNKWVHHHYMISKKERITLADLFSAELADGNSSKKSTKLMQPPAFTKKDAPKRGMGSHVFPKTKLIPAGLKDDSRPLKKLNQLMKKMLKRKIHPDASNNYKDYSSTNGIIPSVDEVCNNDSVSLLQNSRYGI